MSETQNLSNYVSNIISLNYKHKYGFFNVEVKKRKIYYD